MKKNEQLSNAMALLNENENWKIVREYILEEFSEKTILTDKDFECDTNKFYLDTLAKHIAYDTIKNIIDKIDTAKTRKTDVQSWS